MVVITSVKYVAQCVMYDSMFVSLMHSYCHVLCVFLVKKT